MKNTIHDTVKRPWGYETLITTVFDDGDIFNSCMCSEKIPDNKEIIIECMNMALSNKVDKIKEAYKELVVVAEIIPVVDKPLPKAVTDLIAKVTTEVEAAISEIKKEK